MTIYLVRHGQSVGNQRNLFSGVLDHPLTDAGRRQAAEAGMRLRGRRFAAVFTSVLSRAVDTAAIILEQAGGTAGAVVRDARLNERDFGVLEGTPHPHPPYADPDDPACRAAVDAAWRPEGGESIRDTARRAIDCFETVVVPAAARGDVLVVSHGNTIKCLIAHHLDWPLDLVPEMPMRNCLITAITPPAGR